MKEMEKHLRDVEEDKWLYWQVGKAWGHAFTMHNRFNKIETLLASDPAGVAALVPEMDEHLVSMKIELSCVLPASRPLYQAGSGEDWLAVLTKIGSA